MVTGLNAVIGILLALNERERSGKGQFVEAALYDSGLSLLHPHAANWFLNGKTPVRTGNAHPNIYPYDSFPTRTSAIYLAVGNDRQFQILCRVLGEPSLAFEPEFRDAGSRSSNRDALRGRLTALLMQFDGESLTGQLMNEGVPCAPVLDVKDALEHPHTAHREMIVSMPNGYKGLGSPIKLSRTPATYRLPPPDESGS
jgi:crotonobetainyl-CoA:carnitine CoA-transferase CaiB-like acyl-CoA transferase